MNAQTKIQFDQQLANYIAALAKLDLNHPALSNFIADMEGMLAMIEVMNEVDTDGVEPLYHPIELTSLQREDQANNKDNREQLLANAPATNDGLFFVPQVIE